eukprot:4864988-Pleurochrysis_carterae.AAC.1
MRWSLATELNIRCIASAAPRTRPTRVGDDRHHVEQGAVAYAPALASTPSALRSSRAVRQV